MTTTEIESLSSDELDALKLSPEVAWYLQSRGIPIPDCPPAIKTPEPRLVPGAQFDPGRVDKVLKSMHCLRHTKGDFAGSPLDPDPWQVAYIIAPVFGWIRPEEITRDGKQQTVYVRIIKNVYVDVPRKNGKTTLSGGIAMYLTAADGEMGAEVYALAAGREQARRTFDPVKQIAQKSPDLGPHVKCVVDKIVHRRTGSFFQVASAVADLMQGANIHGAIIDELHIHKKSDLVDITETGTGARLQPLIFMITTADENKMNTVYARKRIQIEELAKGLAKNEKKYGVIWCADEKDDPYDPETQRKANPGYGVSPSIRYLKEAAEDARNSPAELAVYKRLHLGIRTKQKGAYIELSTWDRNASTVNESKLESRACYGGLDLASTEDLTALCWVFPDNEHDLRHAETFDAIWRIWIPEGNLENLNKRTQGEAWRWIEQGFIKVTPGDTTDYQFVRKQINDDRAKFNVKEITYDPWNSGQLIRDLETDGMGGDNSAGLIKLGQGFAHMNAPTKGLHRLLLAGTHEHPVLRHGGHPVARWAVDNLVVMKDPYDNVRPDRKNSPGKIDPVVALIMALRTPIIEAAKPEYDVMDSFA